MKAEKPRHPHGTVFANGLSEHCLWSLGVSLNGIAGSAVSALKTNSAALAVVANNVANLNTVGYARRVVNQQTLAANGQLMGVDIASVQRITNQFFAQEQLSAGSAASQYDTMAGLFSQLNGLLGGPGDNQSLSTQLTNLASAFATASQAPTSTAGRTGMMNALNGLASNISSVAGTINGMRGQIDQQMATSIAPTNALIKQIYDLNMQIRQAAAVTSGGAQNSGLQDQRDVALAQLANTMDIKTTVNADGSISVATADGVNLVSNTYAQLAYQGGAQNGAYGSITTQDVNPNNGNLIGIPQPLDAHLSGGTLKGMMDMRDQVLGGLAQSLGNLAQQTATAFNAQANANAAYPPPTSLTGRQTGLLSTDDIGFSGKTTIAVTGANGTLVSRIDVDFGAGTLSVDGGAPASIGTDLGSFATALNAALGANGTASFANGKLSIAATGTNGVLVKDDAATPASRGGAGFSQFFGLNDVFQSQMPSLTATGLGASDLAGFAPGSAITVSLKGPEGDIGKSASITIAGGETIGNIVTALNTALGGAATFTLNSDGSISSATSALFPGYSLDIPIDSTQRGTTGVSFSTLFGLGSNAQRLQAMGFAVTPAVTANPARVGFATANLTSSTVAGDSIVSAGDNSGAIALQNVITKAQNFHAAGGIAAQTASLSDYVGTFYQNVSTQSNTITSYQTTQDDRLNEAKSRVASNSGVNLDEELTSLSSYQQAYAASARMLTVLDQLYKTLLDIQ